jgi:hypothetical protein
MITQASPVTRRELLSLRLGASAAHEPIDDPFASYETAYAQINEARPFLAEEAHRLGIKAENRDDLEIVRKIFSKAELPSG